jgi:hypothetical protein
MKIKGRDTKPLSKEDREVFDWIGQKLQDVHDGKDVYLTAEEVEKDRQEWLKTQTPSEKLQEQLEPIEDDDKDEDEVGEEPDTEEEQYEKTD